MSSAMERYLEWLKSPHVTIKVGQGEDAKEFSLPRELLCARWKWFASALSPDRFKEGCEGVVKLPDDSPRAFGAFAYWLYQDKIEFDGEKHEPRRSYGLTLCAETYTFGDNYGLSNLQNCVMHYLCALMDDSCYEDQVPASTLTACFKTGIDGSPVRLIITDYVVNRLVKSKQDSTSFTIEPELGGYPGFLEAIHASEEARHALGSDFPRYMKPIKFSSLFHLEVNHEEIDKDLYLSDWNEAPKCCDDCGFNAEPFGVRCRICEQSQCTCGSFDHVLLCGHCG